MRAAVGAIGGAVAVGAGAVGSSVALHAAGLGYAVTVLEKEAAPALHQSGRNSGVIHAGYNLKPGSLKAKYCVEGSRQLRAYCRERGIPMQQGGILIVARTDAERATLAELHRRAQGNGVESCLVGEEEIRRIEPHAWGIAALHAPEGASFDAPAYVRSLLAEARAVKTDQEIERIYSELEVRTDELAEAAAAAGEHQSALPDGEEDPEGIHSKGGHWGTVVI